MMLGLRPRARQCARWRQRVAPSRQDWTSTDRMRPVSISCIVPSLMSRDFQLLFERGDSGVHVDQNLGDGFLFWLWWHGTTLCTRAQPPRTRTQARCTRCVRLCTRAQPPCTRAHALCVRVRNPCVRVRTSRGAALHLGGAQAHPLTSCREGPILLPRSRRS